MRINKLVSVLSVLILLSGVSQAKSIDDVIKASNIRSECVSISIKSIPTKKVYYEHNELYPMSPASIQKIVTTIPAIKTLGDKYQFETKLYKNAQGDYLIKLGADPYLTTDNLRSLTRTMPDTIKSISIDDSVIDKIEWGEGWQWDDSDNPLMPKFSSYNIDRNSINVYVAPTTIGAPANITTNKYYPINIINKIVTGDKNACTVQKKTFEAEDIVLGEGVVQHTTQFTLPVNSPRKYFKLRLTDVLLDSEKSNSGIYNNKKLTANYTLVNRVAHDISQAKSDILKNSDNYVSETLFKLAGGKYKKCTGSFDAGLEMFNNYCETMKLDNSGINIVDASGVSKNNLMIADFMTDFLLLNRIDLEPLMATAGEGTLSDRLLYLRGNIKAKTGTLTNISSLAGYISTQNGHKYVFCIIIQDSISKPKDKKLLEDNIIKTLYLKG